MKEKHIEIWLGEEIWKMGGLYFKWVSPGTIGVPDRIIMLPGGVIWFIELKQAGKKASPWQHRIQDEIRKRGGKVRELAGLEQVEAFLAELREAGHGV